MTNFRTWLVPLEPFPERYTADWHKWFPAEFARLGLPLTSIEGVDRGSEAAPVDPSINFLHPTKTWRWKAEQISALASLWDHVRPGDVFLVTDGWHPIVLAIRYMAALTQKPVLVAAIWHAGAYDPWDRLAQDMCRGWALDAERGMMRACDLIFLGSEFHSKMVWDLIEGEGDGSNGQDSMRLAVDAFPKLAVTGLPVNVDDLRTPKRAGGYWCPWHQRGPLVVFPHRLVEEKGVEFWREIKDCLLKKANADGSDRPDVRIIETHAEGGMTKADYYDTLGQARDEESCAKQETFGIAMLEGVALGAYAVAPDALSYPEMIDPDAGWLYVKNRGAESIANRILELLKRPTPAAWDGRHEDAIERMIAVIIKGREAFVQHAAVAEAIEEREAEDAELEEEIERADQAHQAQMDAAIERQEMEEIEGTD